MKAVFKSWLFTLGRNLLIDELRKLNRWQPLEMEEQAGQTPSLDEQIASADRLAQFNHLLETTAVFTARSLYPAKRRLQPGANSADHR